MTIELTRDELSNASGLWNYLSDISHLHIALEYPSLFPYFEQLKNHRVIEVGPGENPITKYYPCGEYVPAASHANHNDGWSVLKRQDPLSSIVVSFGVLDDCILLNDETPYREDVTTKYIHALVEQMRRVAHPFGIIFGLDAVKYMGEPDVPGGNMGGVYFSEQFAKKF